jgi:DNA-binding NarL/FixJ family response regulator
MRRLRFRPAPVVVLADHDDLAQIPKALECGARGYIPSSVGIEICAEAICLALAGGTFVPASSVVAMKSAIDPLIEFALHAASRSHRFRFARIIVRFN